MAVANVVVDKRLLEVLKPFPARCGVRTDPSGKTIKNIVLSTISDPEYDLLRPHLEQVALPHHFILHHPGQRMDFAYFVNEGMVSLVVTMNEGRSVEVGVVGREGMVGTALVVGIQQAPYCAIMQIPGSGVRISSQTLEEILAQCPELRLQLNRYAHVQGLQVAQIAACNRVHEIAQRLARWLLMCQDRVDSELLFLTHEFLGEMLGTGRPTVSLAAGILQRSELIENLRGTIQIINRKGLEAAACECYGVIQHFNGGLGLR